MDTYIRLRDGGICVYCVDDLGQVLDHVFPVKHGGRFIRENLVLACIRCNAKKSGRLNDVWLARGFAHLLSVGESLEWVDKYLKSLPAVDSSNKLLTPFRGICKPSVQTEKSEIIWEPLPEKRKYNQITSDRCEYFACHLTPEDRRKIQIEAHRCRVSMSALAAGYISEALKNVKDSEEN